MGLTARIRTRDGWAVSHAVVTVTDMTGTQVLRAEADTEGAVHDPTPLTPGAYTVIVTAVGYAPAASSAIVTVSGRAEVGNVTLARQGGNELPPPGPWTVDPAHSSVGAVAQHLGISSVHGRFTDFSAAIEISPDDVSKSRVEAVISAASIDTGNGMRDGHLKSPDFLDVETYPQITYRSTGLTPAGFRPLDRPRRTHHARHRPPSRPGPRLPGHGRGPLGRHAGRLPGDDRTPPRGIRHELQPGHPGRHLSDRHHAEGGTGHPGGTGSTPPTGVRCGHLPGGHPRLTHMAPNIATNTAVSLDELLDFVRPRHRAILLTRRADGSPQGSP